MCTVRLRLVRAVYSLPALRAGGCVMAATADYVRTAIDRAQARSMVMTTGGVVASEHPLASQAGAAVLARGGHAVDAAIAANAVMGAVAPMMNGIGGDLFAIVHEAATGAVHGLNGSGPAPAALSIAALRALGITRMPQTGIHAVTVPGAVAAWEKLSARFGRLPLADVLAPAIRVAADGVPVAEITAAEWEGSEGHLRADPEAARVFLPAGRPPRAGEVFRNPDLAHSYRLIAAGGRDAFYAGEIAQTHRRPAPHGMAARWPPATSRATTPSGWRRSRRPIAAGPCTNCPPTGRASRR